MIRRISLLLILLHGVISVDRGNFKTCDQSGFCKRNRRVQPGTSPFIALLPSAVQKDDKTIILDLLHTKTQHSYIATLTAFDGPSVRVLIDEKNSVQKRYEATPSFKDSLSPIPITLSSQDDSKIEAKFGGDNKVVITGQPFRIDVYSGDTLVISGNARGMMKFEHFRPKDKPVDSQVEEKKVEEDPTKVSYNERGEKIVNGEAEKFDEDGGENGNEGDVANEYGEDLENAWEESYKGHQDTKPRGPMSVGMDFTFEGFDYVYGLPEHADSFALNPTRGKSDPYRMYNLDVFEYETSNPMALYGAVPFMMAHSEAKTAAMLWLNPSETWIDVESPSQGVLSSVVDFVSNKKHESKRETHWFSETGLIDVFFFVGPRPADIARQYAQITGVTPLPPLFSLAYHQCRWNYNDQDDVRQVDAGFDVNDIPYDVLWLDIEHTDGKRYFTWDGVKFSDPETMIKNLTSKGRRMVTIVDPHIKRDSNYHVHSEATEKGYYVKDRSGNDFDGWCWPGSSSYLDFFSPEVREYWASKFSLEQYKGSTDQLFTWNDMNEPSVFNGPELTMSKDNKHVDGLEHRDVHNMYGMMQHMSTYEGHLRRSGGKLRPFVLTRSFFAGSQRYGAVWTGDNMAAWDHVRITIPMLLSLSVSGITFVGADVGGFFKNPDHEMVARWYQMGALQPFFRGHAHHDTKRREPWLFDENTNTIVRDSLRMRYAMLPLWYTLFYENEVDSQPPMRPLWWNFPLDKESFARDDIHLIGNTLLARPVQEQGASSVEVYFPGKDTVWYDYFTHQPYNGGQKMSIAVTMKSIPLYQRGGSILSTKERVRRCSALAANDPYTITVAVSKDGTFANGTLYMDDEVSFEYKNGNMIYAALEYKNNVLSYQLLKGPGGFKTPSWVERIIFVGLPKAPTKITSGERLMEFSRSETTLTVRKPAFHMDSTWSIQLHF